MGVVCGRMPEDARRYDQGQRHSCSWTRSATWEAPPSRRCAAAPLAADPPQSRSAPTSAWQAAASARAAPADSLPKLQAGLVYPRNARPVATGAMVPPCGGGARGRRKSDGETREAWLRPSSRSPRPLRPDVPSVARDACVANQTNWSRTRQSEEAHGATGDRKRTSCMVCAWARSHQLEIAVAPDGAAALRSLHFTRRLPLADTKRRRQQSTVETAIVRRQDPHVREVRTQAAQCREVLLVFGGSRTATVTARATCLRELLCKADTD